jgi:hypothetical protein
MSSTNVIERNKIYILSSVYFSASLAGFEVTKQFGHVHF